MVTSPVRFRFTVGFWAVSTGWMWKWVGLLHPQESHMSTGKWRVAGDTRLTDFDIDDFQLAASPEIARNRTTLRAAKDNLLWSEEGFA
jgi:hypothetical protein